MSRTLKLFSPKLALPLLMLAALAGCDGGGANQTPPEEPPVPTVPPVPTAAAARIEIVQTGLLFTAAGQTRQLEARVLDAAGNAITLPVSWSSSDTGAIAVSAGGLATASGRGGSTQIVAAVGELRSVPLLAVVTELASGTLVIADEQVVVAPAEINPGATPSFDNTYSVVVAGVATPTVGTLVIGNGSQPIAGRVVGTEAVAGGVRLTLQLAPATELLPNLDIDQVFDLSQVEPEIAPEIASAYDIRRDGDTLYFTAKAADASRPASTSRRPASKAAQPRARPSVVGTPIGTRAFEQGCETDFEAENPPISMTNQPAFSVSLKPALDLLYTPNRGLEHLLLTATPTFTFNVQAKLTAAFEGKISCKAELFNIPLPIGGPLSLIVGGMVPVGVGVEAGGKLTVADVTVGTQSAVGTELEFGLACNFGVCDFQRSFGEFTVTNTPTLVLRTLESLRVEPKLEAFGYAEVAIGNRFFKSLRFKTLEAKVGAALEGSFAPQITQMLASPYQSDYKLKLGAEAKAGSEMALTLTLLGLESLAKLELKVDTELANSPTGKVSADRSDFLAGETTNFTIELDAAKANFLGIYNIAEVLIVEKLADGTAVIRARQTATDGATRFTVPYVAAAGGTTGNFFAFVLTRLLPADLLSLELGQVRGAGFAELLRARVEAVSGSSNCSSESCNNPSDSEVRIEDSLGSAVRARYTLVSLSANLGTRSTIGSDAEIGLDERSLFSTISLSCNGDAEASGFAPQTGTGRPFSAGHTLSQFAFAVSQPVSYRIDIPKSNIVSFSDQAGATVSVGLIEGNQLPPEEDGQSRIYGGATTAVDTGNPLSLVVLHEADLDFDQEFGSRTGILQPGVYTVATACTQSANTSGDTSESSTLHELQTVLTLSAAP
ncbi:hypothetical protein [uncultured Nevskia sp.]|uniref:hypothetical protein n=1 Tax=uncultured Nevskia sp. TaxID=228950 RepID=UPI0025D85FA2|nr:hypothetical protein [uncultured Nevskia sp.]